jgi:hypothetical protein
LPKPLAIACERILRFKRVFEKSHAGAIRFSIGRIEARSIIISEVCTRYSGKIKSSAFAVGFALLVLIGPASGIDSN